MKRLKAGGAGLKKKRVEPISFEEEEILWQKGLLGSATPQSLLDTMIYMCGVYFACILLREVGRNTEICNLLNYNKWSRQRPRLYRECIENNPGGLKHRKVESKVVLHYVNPTGNKDCCFVSLYKLYVSLSPPLESRKTNAFYLTPLRKLKGQYWYS